MENILAAGLVESDDLVLGQLGQLVEATTYMLKAARLLATKSGPSVINDHVLRTSGRAEDHRWPLWCVPSHLPPLGHSAADEMVVTRLLPVDMSGRNSADSQGTKYVGSSRY